MSVVWEEPPKRAGGGGPHAGKWVPLLAPLAEHPKRWAMVRDAPSAQAARSTANNLNKRVVVIPAGEWEFVARGSKVYARYMGEGSA